MLGPYCFCPLACPFLHEMFPWYIQFSWADLWPFPYCNFPLFLFFSFFFKFKEVFLSLLAILWNSGFSWIYLSLSSLLFTSLSSAIVKPFQGNTFLFAFLFLLIGFGYCLLYNVINLYLLEKEMATHSCVLAWRIPGTGEPGGRLSLGSHRVGHDWRDLVVSIVLQVLCQIYSLESICHILCRIIRDLT